MTSANIVGYQQVSIPSGYYIFTPTFKNIGENQQFDIKTLRPYLINGNAVSRNQTVKIFVLDNEGNYGVAIVWYGSTGIWTKDGATAIADGEVMVGTGNGIAVQNTVKVNSSTGAEVAKGGVTTPIYFLVSGEVDLICQNVVPAGYMINGNSTPAAINLRNVTPRLPNGNAVSRNQTVKIFLLDDEGNYGPAIVWYGATGIWTTDGSAEISTAEGALAVGQGFAVQNTVKVNASTGTEVAKGGASTPIYLELPSPIVGE